MRTELEKLMYDTFPNLYRQKDLGPHRSSMCWGLPGDGWFGLLWECSEAIEKELLTMPEDERPSAIQVKEKFGTLRFYMSGFSVAIDDAIRRAEDRSCVECEECGAEAARSDGGWIKTLCNKCNDLPDGSNYYRGQATAVTINGLNELVIDRGHGCSYSFDVPQSVLDRFDS